MADLAVSTALTHSGSFGKNFVKFKKEKISTILRRFVLCSLSLEYSRPRARPSVWGITYISSEAGSSEHVLPLT